MSNVFEESLSCFPPGFQKWNLMIKYQRTFYFLIQVQKPGAQWNLGAQFLYVPTHKSVVAICWFHLAIFSVKA